jgi:hypothetical protein
MVERRLTHPADFYCLEITPHFSDRSGSYFAFDVGITTKSRVKPNSMVATSPEFREFLSGSEPGRIIRDIVASGRKTRVPIGRVSGATNGSVIKYSAFNPFGHSLSSVLNSYHGLEDLTFAEILKGKGISSLIESNILKYLKQKFPKAELHYSVAVITKSRIAQLKKIRHKDPYDPGFIEEEHGLFKKFLKKQRLRKLGKK